MADGGKLEGNDVVAAVDGRPSYELCVCGGGGKAAGERPVPSAGGAVRGSEESKKLLLRIADVCAEFLVGQVKAGAQVS